MRSNFATFLILCPTSFFLGILFTNWTYDHHLLWSDAIPSAAILDAAETHYTFVANSPPILPRLLHCVIGVGLLGFFTKLYKASESNYLFDGASLVLYMVGVIMYGTNVVRGLRTIEARAYGTPTTSDDGKEGAVLGREDTLKVMAATSTILALVLVGVLVLQAGQWYAERKEGEEVALLEKQDEEERRKVASGAAAGGEATTAPLTAPVPAQKAAAGKRKGGKRD